jgi:hypothetical protein
LSALFIRFSPYSHLLHLRRWGHTQDAETQ